MNERFSTFVSGGAALGSITAQHFSTGVSIAAGLIAIAAGLPVAVDRWRHKLPHWITRHFPQKAA